jgi:hypothetical protein
MVPPVVSPVAGAIFPNESLAVAVADQVTVVPADPAVKVQLKFWLAPGARLATLAGVNVVHGPVPVTDTDDSVLVPVLVSMTVIVTGLPGSTDVGVPIAVVSVVDALTTVMVPFVVSPAAGAVFPNESLAVAVADQETVVPAAPAVNVQLKLWLAPGARLATLAGVYVVHGPVPLTDTDDSILVPVLVSMTVIVTGLPGSTDVGVLIAVVSVVAALITVMVPFVVSPAAGAIFPNESLAVAVADQETVVPAAPAVKVQLKFWLAPGAKVATLAGVYVVHAPVPVTDTDDSVSVPVLVSMTVIVTGLPGSTDVGVPIAVVSVVAARTTVIVPLVVSPVAGAVFPSESLAVAVADQEAVVPAAPAVNVQLKFWLAPGARVATLAGVYVVHAPVPVTDTDDSVSVPVLVSITVIVTELPGSTDVGVPIAVVNVVEALITLIVPLVVSPVAGAVFPNESLAVAVADQETVVPAAPAVKVQLKFWLAPGARVATLAGVYVVQAPVPVTDTDDSVSVPVLVSMTVIVTELPGSTDVGVLIAVVSVVDALITLIVPLVVSPVAGAVFPNESLAVAVADQEAVVPAAPAVNVQLKFWLAPGARVATLAGVYVVHAPVPVTDTDDSVSVPVLVSITVIVTELPGSTDVGVLIAVVNVVAALITLIVPLVVSPVAGAIFPSESLAVAVADQETVVPAAPAVNVQLKFWLAPGARVATLAGVYVVHAPVPVTDTDDSVSVPVLVSMTVIVTELPGSTDVGVLIAVVNVVAARITVMVPFVDSLSDGAGWPAASVPDAEAPQFVVSLTVKVQL